MQGESGSSSTDFQCSDSSAIGVMTGAQSQTSNATSFDLIVTFEQFFYAIEPRWFFMAFANCDESCTENLCDGPLIVDYDFSLLNGGGFFTNHFSADEMGILETEITFLALQALLTMHALQVALVLRKRRKLHKTVLIFVFSVVVQSAAIVFNFVHYYTFAKDGLGNTMLKTAALYATNIAETILLIALILLAKGWTIVFRKLSNQGLMRIALYSSIYTCVLIFAITWSTIHYDPATNLYFYETVPGYVVVVLRVLAIFWFCYSTSNTIHKMQSKIHFYRKLTLGVFFWLMSLPLLLLISIATPSTMRAVLLNIVTRSLFFVAQATMSALYDPRIGAESFPFHAISVDRKGRIGAGKKKDGDESTSTAFTNPGWEDSDDDEGEGEHDGVGDSGFLEANRGGVNLKRKMEEASQSASRLQLTAERLTGSIQELLDVGEDDVGEDEAFAVPDLRPPSIGVRSS